MKPDYKNWMPKGMIYAFLAAFLGCAAALAVFSLVLTEGTIKTVLTIVFAVLTLLFCVLTKWSILMYRAFDYNGKRKMAKQIIDGTAAYVKLPEGLSPGNIPDTEEGRKLRDSRHHVAE